MKTISLTLIPFLISIASYPTLIKAPSSYVPSGSIPAAGGGSTGFNSPTGPGYRSGETAHGGSSGISGPTGPGYRSGGPSGYRNGSPPGKRYGGDTGAAIIVFPRKKPAPTPIPAECKSIAGCVTTHIAGASPKEPQYHGKCCTEFKTSVSCVCKFLMSTDKKQQSAANGVVRSCNFKNPICIKKPMPPSCRPEVKHCVAMHMYRRASKPTFQSPCCQKFKTSKRCIMAFKNSPDPRLSQAAKGVIEGCRFF
ncbi:hypothetical protein Bca4012_058121 [Brassica carinata]